MKTTLEQEVNSLHPICDVDRPVAVELKNITKTYGEEIVVDDLNLSIQQGEFFSLLGPSGSGKTTSLMMVAGFTNPDSGQIFIDGNDVVPKPPQKRGFGMVFQNYAIFPHLSVSENVAFPLRARRVPPSEIEKRVSDALRMVHLEKFAQRSPKQLSGGQLQRVALARAIVFHPSVVLMDEPMGALDKNLRYQMQAEIKEIQNRLDMTVLYVTHDQEEAMSMSDRLAIMNKGHIEQVATPLDVYERPRNEFVAQFLGLANFLHGTVVTITTNTAAVELANGKVVVCEMTDRLKPKDRVCIFIRPERLKIIANSKTKVDNTNTLPASVTRIAYLGNVIRYHVATDEGIELTSEISNSSRLHSAQIGSVVTLEWDVQSCIALPRSS